MTDRSASDPAAPRKAEPGLLECLKRMLSPTPGSDDRDAAWMAVEKAERERAMRRAKLEGDYTVGAVGGAFAPAPPAHGTPARERGLREAAALVCGGCRRGDSPTRPPHRAHIPAQDDWWHEDHIRCSAGRIMDRLAEPPRSDSVGGRVPSGTWQGEPYQTVTTDAAAPPAPEPASARPCEHETAEYILALAAGMTKIRERERKLEEALRVLIIDANRLCDRNLGGTYETDCRRSIEAARAALEPEKGE